MKKAKLSPCLPGPDEIVVFLDCGGTKRALFLLRYRIEQVHLPHRTSLAASQSRSEQHTESNQRPESSNRGERQGAPAVEGGYASPIPRPWNKIGNVDFNTRHTPNAVRGSKSYLRVRVNEGLLVVLLIGVCNGLSSQAQIIAIDMNREAYEIGLPSIKNAGVEHKINFIQSDAITALDQMLINGENETNFDFAFVDADKINYLNYHEKLLKLVKVGGVIGYDNTLWSGSVALKEGDEIPEFLKASIEPTKKLNNYLTSDPHIELSHISIGDGC
ncbi:hypothetical protein IFM89_029414 [Coptis chinensis]|uniref:Caffeoyl-CoA O-methyltransferase n=1 Tax=Coptis chinensis TaxID=261450 RepID=A0A835INB5_9MAGN|nr:hypothetical protein IFM89_029414 [Coptis chinensis]